MTAKNARQTNPFRILITDDDREVRETLAELVGLRGFESLLAASGEEAFEIIQAEPVHLILLDMHMPRLTGLETLELVRQINRLLPAILITADATMDVMKRAMNAQVFSVIPKPVNGSIVVATMIRALFRSYGDPLKGSPDPTKDTPANPDISTALNPESESP